MVRQEHEAILPIQPIECLITGRMWIRVALDKLNNVDDRLTSGWEDQAKGRIVDALADLDAAVRNLEE